MTYDPSNPGHDQDPVQGLLPSAASWPTSAADCLELAHALCYWAAEVTGVRLLAIKGPVAEHFQHRPPRVSSDVDVWVEQSGLDAFLAQLAAAGWHPRRLSVAALAASTHSLALSHSAWSCDIDVHHHFPGLLAGAEAFDALWSRREPHLLAELPCWGLDEVGSLMVSAAHGLRSAPRSAQARADLVYLQQRVLPLCTERRLDELSALAIDVWAAPELVDFLGLSALLSGEPDHKASRRWSLALHGGSTRTARILDSAGGAPWPRRAFIFMRSIWPSEEDMRLDHPEIVAGRGPLFRARIARIGRGFRSIPGVVRGYRLAKRGVTDASALKDPQ